MTPRPIHRIGLGTDLHRLEPGRPLRLGGVNVPADRGPIAHSDGDVVLHALIDGISGAAGLPDIGEQFPDDDPRYRGADSAALLAATLDRVRAAGWTVVNADVVIHVERPRLAAQKSAIRSRVAALLSVPDDCVSIKAKTGEGVDAVGRGEAIACTAIVGLAHS